MGRLRKFYLNEEEYDNKWMTPNQMILKLQNYFESTKSQLRTSRGYHSLWLATCGESQFNLWLIGIKKIKNKKKHFYRNY